LCMLEISEEYFSKYLWNCSDWTVIVFFSFSTNSSAESEATKAKKKN